MPNDPGKWGPLAGTILVAPEDSSGDIYAVSLPQDPAVGQGASDTPHAKVTTYPINVHGIEDLDLVPTNANFFGINGTGVAGGQLFSAPASDFAGMAGDILICEEFPAGGDPSSGAPDRSGFTRLYWDGTGLKAEPVGGAEGSTHDN